ncbi:hypothetical protein Tco_0530949 [Tanacetum coccineum]
MPPRRQPLSSASIKRLIAQCVADALTAYKANTNNGTGTNDRAGASDSAGGHNSWLLIQRIPKIEAPQLQQNRRSIVPADSSSNVPADYVSAGHVLFQTATISANNAKFPYLEKEKYEIWAMKMEYWIQNADHNLWRIVQQGNSPKRLGKDAKGNTIVHPPVTMMSMVAEQQGELIKLEEEGLHKGYDRFQKILSQLNQVQARPDNDDINLNYSVKADVAPTHSAFIGTTCSSSKPTYSDQQHIVPSVSPTSGRSDNLMECVLHSFVAENDQDQDDDLWMNFNQVDQVENGRNGLKVANGYALLED